MLLAIDVGNSTTSVGLFDGDRLAHRWRLSTRDRRTPDELALQLFGFMDLGGVVPDEVTGVVIASVVPPVTSTLEQLVEQYLHVPAVIVAPGIRTGIQLRYEDPREIGADRIANAVAVAALHGGPAIAVDFGTSTNFDVISRDGAFVGGAIAPGVATSTAALVDSAAQLQEVAPALPPSPIGRTTIQALQSGIVHGFAGQVDAIVTCIAAELGPDVTTVATGGGMVAAVLDACTTIDHHDPMLTLKGLRLIWERNEP